jgi:Glycosyl hydrolases family 2, TIM barrel domain
MKPKKPLPMIDPAKYGVSFSAKQCRNFDIGVQETLQWLLDSGWQRFRLMSYWNEHEKVQGTYNFRELDEQIKLIATYGGEVSLCLGVKQPRWPEYHWPKWAKALSPDERTTALLQYIEAVVERYKNNKTITSWQLENEALLKGFGESIQVDRKRLRAEYELVQKLDGSRPVIMSTSNGWGIPARKPRPDIIGFSYYPIMFQKGKYRTTIQKPWLHKARKTIIQKILRKDVFIHELQLEPWGPTAIWKMNIAEQDKSMGVQHIAKNITLAKKINAYPIDIWGAEWWYWRLKKHDDPTIWRALAASLTDV